MASTLCVRVRRDVRVVPGVLEPSTEGQEAEPSPQIADLVKLMRATCLDVAESATNSDMQLIDSAICVARAVKMNGRVAEEEADQLEVEGLPGDLAYMTWGMVVRYNDNPFGRSVEKWTQECTLPALMQMPPVEASDVMLAVLHDDLLLRSTSNIPGDIGALIKYRMVVFDSYDPSWRRHAYLFENAIVVMGDGEDDDSLIPTLISTDTKLDSPLKLIHLAYIRNVKEVVMTWSAVSSDYVYDLTFKHGDTSYDFALGFNDTPTAVAWITVIRQLQYHGEFEESYSPKTEDIAAFVAFAVLKQTHQWQLKVSQTLNRVLCHGAVTVHGSDASTGYCHLVMFDHVLLFVQGTPPKPKRYVLASSIVSVEETATDNGSGIAFTYGSKLNGSVLFEEFRFEPADTETDVGTWLRMLRTFAPNASTLPNVQQKLRMLAFIHSQPETVPQLGGFATTVAGLAMLHATSVPDELNISVGVLPTFESDGLATHLLAHILEIAFEKFNAHRVQARVVHSSTTPSQTARAVRLLIHLGFTHEGIRRRAALHPTEGQWADVSVLAMLELDWVTRAAVAPTKGTLWDEMFARQQRDREMLLNMEGLRGLKKTRSMETVRDLCSMDDAVPSASMVSSSVGCPTVRSDTESQASVPTAMSSWSGTSDGYSLQAGEAKRSSVVSMPSADDAADEYEEWDLEEDYSDDDDDDGTESKD